jgi:tetratricopeptide (TPR) repeat protein
MTDDKPPPAPILETPGTRVRHRSWRLWLVLLVIPGVAAGACAWWWLGAPQPPTVDLAGADPEIAAAVNAARVAVLWSPRSPAAWGKFGKVLAAHRFLPAARASFIEAHRLQPEDARWPYFEGLTLAFSDNDRAIVLFQEALQLRGAAPSVRFRLAETLAGQGRPEEAEQHYRQLVEDPSLSARAELGLARLALQRGDLQVARSRADRATTDPGTQKAAHSLLAEIAQRSDDQDAAAREWAAVSKLPEDMDWPDPLLNEMMREKVGKDVRLAQALELTRQNRVQEAATAFQDLVKAHPDWDQGWLNYGRLLMEHSAFPEAEQAFRQVLRLEPDSVSGHYQLGVVLFQRDQWREAAEHFREAVRLKPDHALAYYNLGHCLKRLNDRAGAMEAFRAAVRSRPDMARAHTNLGELLAEQGNKSAAAEEIRLSLELNPQDEVAKKLREQLGPAK